MKGARERAGIARVRRHDQVIGRVRVDRSSPRSAAHVLRCARFCKGDAKRMRPARR